MTVNYWVIGFLWGSSRISGEHLIVQNIDISLLEKLKLLGNIENKIFQVNTPTGNISYRLKIHENNKYVKQMLKDGYEGRTGNVDRLVPNSINADNEYDFLCGYFCTHFSLDQVVRNNKIVSRLRFYASQNVLNLLNEHLNSVMGIGIKKTQRHSGNAVCKILHYQPQKEIPKIIDHLQLKR